MAEAAADPQGAEKRQKNAQGLVAGFAQCQEMGRDRREPVQQYGAESRCRSDPAVAEGEHRRQAPTFACGSAGGQSRRRRELLLRDRRELVLALAAVGKAEV